MMLDSNRSKNFGQRLLSIDADAFSPRSAAEAIEKIQTLSASISSPLRWLSSLAEAVGVESICVKDESARLGQQSFKALGAGHALVCLVHDLMSKEFGQQLSLGDLRRPDIRDRIGRLTFGCATDGNHGRALAAAAKSFGASARIFVHEHVDPRRITSIASLGADIVIVRGNYDDAVAQASSICSANGWILVSDTAEPGYEDVPRLVMQGYTILASEILNELSRPPTHVFLQAGVGGFAAALAAHFHLALGLACPRLIVVEPENAACLFQSNRMDRPSEVRSDQSTVMAMLECYKPSSLAWKILSRLANAYMTVSDDEAVLAGRIFASPHGGDPVIASSESGSAGLAGLISLLGSPEQAQMLGLNNDARVLLINTEAH